MVSCPNEVVSVRLLSGGNSHKTRFQSLEGRLLNLTLAGALDNPPIFKPGELVEATSPGTLYLGEVLREDGGSLQIEIEHALDREALAAIREVWTQPDVS